MKKTSKILSFILCAAMAASAVPSISADALAQWVNAAEKIVNPNPDTFVEYSVNNKSITYRRSDFLYSYYEYNDFRYNNLNCKIEEGYDWESVYEKYADVLDFDVVDVRERTTGGVSIQMYDTLDDGDDPREANSVEDKQEIIKKFCTALKENGGLVDAKYTAFFSQIEQGRSSSGIWVHDFPGTLEEIKAVTDKYPYKIEIKLNDNNCGSVGVYDDDVKYDDFAAMYAELDALYDSDEMKEDRVWLADAEFVITDTVDILNAIGDKTDNGIAYGDMNVDGNIGIQDAILMNKFIVGSVNFNVDQNKAADLNGDNVVDSEDLSILLQYLVDDIDTFPVAE